MPIDLNSARAIPDARVEERFSAVRESLEAALDAGTFTATETLADLPHPFGMFARESLTGVRQNRASSGLEHDVRLVLAIVPIERGGAPDANGKPTRRHVTPQIRTGDKLVTRRGRQHREPTYRDLPLGVSVAPVAQALGWLARYGVGYRDQLATRTDAKHACVRELGYEWKGQRYLTAPNAAEMIAEFSAREPETAKQRGVYVAPVVEEPKAKAPKQAAAA